MNNTNTHTHTQGADKLHAPDDPTTMHDRDRAGLNNPHSMRTDGRVSTRTCHQKHINKSSAPLLCSACARLLARVIIIDGDDDSFKIHLSRRVRICVPVIKEQYVSVDVCVSKTCEPC